MKISELIANSKMSGFQVRVVVLAIALTVLDGYDLALISFSAPFVAKEFASSASLLGLVLSGALMGMFVGSVLVAPLADRVGRRTIAIFGTAVVVVGMAIAPFAHDMLVMFASRVVTGLGIGTLVAVIGVTISEYSNKRSYTAAMAVYAAGINIGAVLGSLIVGPLLPTLGWRFAFVVGAVLAVLSLIAAAGLFPESIMWLAEGRRSDALERFNSLLAKMKLTPVAELPAPERASVATKGAVRAIFGKGLRWQTILMIAAYVFYMVAFYFANTWVPTTVATVGASPSLAAPTTLTISLGGVVGTVVFGLIAAKVSPRILTPVFLVIGAAGIFVFGLVSGQLSTAFVVIFIASFFFSAGTAGFYAIVPPLYPTLARATGYGTVIGAGRLGGIVAPILGGVAFDAHLPVPVIFAIFSAPLLLSAIAVAILHLGLRARVRDTETADRELTTVAS